MQTYRTSGEVGKKEQELFTRSPKPQQGPCLLLQKEHFVQDPLRGEGRQGGERERVG